MPKSLSAIGFMCLWELDRLGLLPLERESCFGASVEALLREWI